MPWRAAIGVLAAATIVCTGCTSGSAPSSRLTSPTVGATPSEAAGPTGPRLTGSVVTAGAARLNTSFTALASVESAGQASPEPVGSTCAQYAAGYDRPASEGGAKAFYAPDVLSAKVGRTTVYISATIPQGYSGPGVYDSRHFDFLRGDASVNVDDTEGIVTYVFSSTVHGETTLVVNADGSGSLLVDDWGDTEVHGAAGAGSGSISAAVSWLCQD